MVLVICTEVERATAPQISWQEDDRTSLSVFPFWLQLCFWGDCRVTSSCAGPSQAWESVPVVVPEAVLESVYLCLGQGACSAWQRPHLAPTMHLDTETEQGMRMAPEPVILALQTLGGDQRVRLEIFSWIHILFLPLWDSRDTCSADVFQGNVAQTAVNMKRRHGWRCHTAKRSFPAQIIGRRKTQKRV